MKQWESTEGLLMGDWCDQMLNVERTAPATVRRVDCQENAEVRVTRQEMRPIAI